MQQLLSLVIVYAVGVMKDPWQLACFCEAGLARMVNATILRNCRVGGGMLTFVALAQMLDACSI